MLSGEATNTNFIFFCLTRPGLEPTIYRTWGEHANTVKRKIYMYRLYSYLLLITIFYHSRYYNSLWNYTYYCLYMYLYRHVINYTRAFKYNWVIIVNTKWVICHYIIMHSLSRVVVPAKLHTPLSMLILQDFCKI